MVIGLLGAPGSGKSLVARQFARLGCGIVDADALARAALEDPEVVERLRQWWGDAVLDANGRPDRKAVAGVVFGQPDELARLESLIHPRVARGRAALHACLQADPSIVAIVEDTPLLLEKQLEGVCDVLVYVDAPREVRLARVAATRGWAEADLLAREKNQLPLDIKRNRSDHILDNSGDEAQASEQARRLLSLILQARA